MSLLVNLPADGNVLGVTTYLLYPKLNVAIEKAILHYKNELGIASVSIRKANP